MELYQLKKYANNHQAWFSGIANQFLQSKLHIDDVVYEITDISIYYHSSSYSFPHCHSSLAQKKSAQWYYYADDVQILDFTFCDEEDSSSYGGILLRGIKNTTEKIEGPQFIHKKIKKICGENILVEINGKSAITSKVKIEIYRGENIIPKYSVPRPGLSSLMEGWDDYTTLVSYVSPLRYSIGFPENDMKKLSSDLAIVYSYLHGYLAEIFKSYDKKKVIETIQDFEEFTIDNIRKESLDRLSKDDLVAQFITRENRN